MKKLMIAASAALCAAVGFGEIQSDNTVGYTSKAVEAGRFYLIGTQFDKTGTTSAGSVDMNDLITLSSTITAGLYDDDFATAPKISVLNAAGGYANYFYISDGTYDDGADTPLGFDAWCDENGYELKGTQIDAGAAFWISAPAAGSVTFAL